MIPVYISEPEAIDVDTVKDALGGSRYECIPGNNLFTDSMARDYAVLIIRSNTMVKNTILKSFPRLESIIRIGTGLDNVDLDFCKAHDITVFNAPGANADAVSDYTVGVILYVLRKLNTLSRNDIEKWNRFKYVGESIREQTIGIVGFGNIGRLLHKKLTGFSCKGFTVYDPYLTQSDMPEGVHHVSTIEEVLTSSTVVSLHLPLNQQTHHIINDKSILSIRKGAILINAARGGIVDEQAIIDIAQTRGITYVADTVEKEPEVNPRLLGKSYIVVTPHIASLTTNTEKLMIETATKNFLEGNKVTY